jgi:hypothetical protein
MTTGDSSVRTLFVLAVTVLVAVPAAAQIPDHTATIEAARNAALAVGIDVDASECNRFEITKRAALLLASEGAGLLSKPSGNNCNGYAVDVIVYPAGRAFDIVGAGPDGPASAHWMELTPVNPDRWRAPIDLVTAEPAPLPATPVPQPPIPSEYDTILAQLAQVRADLADLKATEHLEHEQTRSDLRAFREAAKKATSKFLEYVPSILSALGLLKK